MRGPGTPLSGHRDQHRPICLHPGGGPGVQQADTSVIGMGLELSAQRMYHKGALRLTRERGFAYQANGGVSTIVEKPSKG